MPGYNLSTTIIGADTLQKVFSDASGICQKALADALNKTAIEAQAEAKTLAPHEHGQLKESIHVENAQAIGKNMQAKVGTDLKYAMYQEYGTGIYSDYPGASKNPITPKQGKVLSWKDSSGNRHFARKVVGVKPKHFMKQAREAAKPKLTQHMEAALRIITAQLAE